MEQLAALRIAIFTSVLIIRTNSDDNFSQQVSFNLSFAKWPKCLDGVAFTNKSYLIYADKSQHPVLIPYAGWTSARISAQIADILLSETMGYETLFVNIFDSDITAVNYVVGCLDPLDQGCAERDTEKPRAHFTLETWTGGINTVQGLAPDIRPPLLSVMNYNLDDSYFLLNEVKQEALRANQIILLDQYEAYNASLFKPFLFFDPWERMFELIPAAAFARCSNIFSGGYPHGISGTNASEALQRYIQLTDDRNISCYNDRVWFSPACRRAPAECVPLILLRYLDWAMQRATLLNMPFAVVLVDPSVTQAGNSYYTAVAAGRFLFQSFEPNDFLFDASGNRPILFNLPRRDAAAQAAGDYRSGVAGLPAHNYGWRLLHDTDPLVYFLAASVAFTDADMAAFMARSRALQAAGATADAASRAVACDWLRASPARWADWIPAICGPGSYSDPTATRCLPCPPGSVCAGRAAQPVDCPPNFYCGANCSRPSPCPPGRGTVQDGATTAADCSLCRESGAVMVQGGCFQV